jgi:hypothetical protein
MRAHVVGGVLKNSVVFGERNELAPFAVMLVVHLIVRDPDLAFLTRCSVPALATAAHW